MNKKHFETLKPSFNGIDKSLLLAMPYEYKGRDIEVLAETDEFTCLCPWSGLPDFARVAVKYTPDKSVVELKSLKFYLQSFRMTGIVHESAVNRILEDVSKCVRPRSMSVEMVFNLRGGIKTTVRAEYKK
ncbi:MAG TPA: NADPH-dependent 7-cyano-7-deazaguanine reductase QueF [Elusimicrobia bacterium]|nr:MAG: hypothetical protein A2278_09265 [Elusimicrobia bacterium RIFOXYA12_FULL_49_49]OGS07406.1 MAG: hypothetical protein A2204_03905 [Elusimicrobia bacterium RIFOXYA1_FULL_47_7]OGS10974.1 MAG: hypothetical protein A2386_06985 [Elusimicrobia bacterium RIFOXYB1_FULL_48_9]OGS14972.1 MAG: hypothetical protein A2251_08120 [Elusimicrobia bacterium RIFOXYA2_FULL_47_53]OGS26093.1 MAG: hypothetical protein A2339_02155 [Elusimicrobia bacterium RIFOXYB12_FULL_50_12]OGS29317.1 MAG: hypothetical protein